MADSFTMQIDDEVKKIFVVWMTKKGNYYEPGSSIL